eukprot:CAMPEP_0177595128 /NCGR_PEP_ID=MMETSP0419_2-20121207/10176_1 /TAXON_ID=582737 /ORGANISM="Tetraselmis sp., Strain GSL018" /LENGTH=1200 /DNA_ID=CAMNT_0019086537 /DNA_START=54 /DNA_END=3657 /DNA_ORIENTATION=+
MKAAIIICVLICVGTEAFESQQPLGILVRTGDRETVQAAIQENPDKVNVVDSYGWTPLLWAVDSGNTAATRVLLQNGADPYAKMASNGWNAVIWASGMPQSIDLLKLLVEEFKVDPNISAENGFTSLMAACKADSEEAVSVLLGAGADANAANVNGVNALMVAAAESKAEVLDRLLAAGVRLDDLAGNTWSAASHACAGGRLEALQWLESNGAELEPKHQEPRALPLSLAAERGFADIVDYLLSLSPSTGSLKAALSQAAAQGHIAIVRKLIGAGAEADSLVDAVGLRPLSLAAGRGRLEAVTILLESGARPESQASDPIGGAPLEMAHSAIREGAQDGTKVLGKLLDAMEDRMAGAASAAEGASWSAEQMRDWLCIQGGGTGCGLAALFLGAGVTGPSAFRTDPVLSSATIQDAWSALSWAYAVWSGDRERSVYLDLSTAIATSDLFAKDARSFFARAAAAGMWEVMQALAGGSLEPWAAADGHDAEGATVLEAAAGSSEMLAKMEPRVREHLRAIPISSWTRKDVRMWVLLEPSLSPLLEAFKASAVDGSQLEDLLVNSGTCPSDLCHAGLGEGSVDDNSLAQWAMRNDLPEVALATVQRALRSGRSYQILWGSGFCGNGSAPAPSVGEQLLARGARFQPALRAALPVLDRHLRVTSPSKWDCSNAVTLLRVAGAPSEVADAAAAAGVAGEQVAGSRGSLLPWPPLSPEDFAQPTSFSPQRLLSWACSWGLEGVASYVIDLAQSASMAHKEAIQAWGVLHGELISMDSPDSGSRSTALQCLLHHSWEGLWDRVAGLVAARVLTIPLPLWTVTDVTNFLHSVNQSGLAHAMHADGVDGGLLARFHPHPEQMFDAQSKAASLPMGIPPGELLRFAVERNMTRLQQFLLEGYAEIHRPVWNHGLALGPSPIELASQLGLLATAASLRKQASARLSALDMAEWTEIDVNNWLVGAGLPELAATLKEDWVRGESLAALAETFGRDSKEQRGQFAKDLAAVNSPNQALKFMQWSLYQSHCNVLERRLEATTPKEWHILVRDRGDGYSLLDVSMWSRACGAARNKMVGMAGYHLGSKPLSSWDSLEVGAWLYCLRRPEWASAFAQDNIVGAQLATWPGCNGQPLPLAGKQQVTGCYSHGENRAGSESCSGAVPSLSRPFLNRSQLLLTSENHTCLSVADLSNRISVSALRPAGPFSQLLHIASSE